MKKSLLALAALTAFAGAASAQSSVTLFGIVDVNARVVENGSDRLTQLATDGLSTSRLGFRGVEDLGGGLRAEFWIEGQLSPDTGGTGQTWQRRSTVALAGGFGEVRLGRDLTPTWNNFSAYDVFGTNGVGNAGNLLIDQGSVLLAGSAVTSLSRVSNGASYFLPSLGGFYGQLTASAGEGADSNKYAGGRVGYAAGPVNVGVAYGVYDEAVELKWLSVGGSYNFGIASVMAQYNQAERGTAEQKNYSVGAAVPFGASTFKVSYGKTERNTLGDPTAEQVAVGYTYDLSKRTTLYATYSQIDNDATLRFNTTGTTTTPALAAGQKSKGYEFGIRHSF